MPFQILFGWQVTPNLCWIVEENRTLLKYRAHFSGNLFGSIIVFINHADGSCPAEFLVCELQTSDCRLSSKTLPLSISNQCIADFRLWPSFGEPGSGEPNRCSGILGFKGELCETT